MAPDGASRCTMSVWRETGSRTVRRERGIQRVVVGIGCQPIFAAPWKRINWKRINVNSREKPQGRQSYR